MTNPTQPQQPPNHPYKSQKNIPTTLIINKTYQNTKPTQITKKTNTPKPQTHTRRPQTPPNQE